MLRIGLAQDCNGLRLALIGDGIAHLGAEQLRLRLALRRNSVDETSRALRRHSNDCTATELQRCSNELNRCGVVRDAWANQSDESGVAQV